MIYGNCKDQTCGYCSLCRTFKALKPLTYETTKVAVTQAQKEKIDLMVASYMMFAITKQSDHGTSLKVLDNKWESMFDIIKEYEEG